MDILEGLLLFSGNLGGACPASLSGGWDRVHRQL